MAVQKLYCVFNKSDCIKWFCGNDNSQSGTYMLISSWHIMETARFSNTGTSVLDYTKSVPEYSYLRSYRLENLKVNWRSSRVHSEKTVTHRSIQHRMTGDYLGMKLQNDKNAVEYPHLYFFKELVEL